MTRLAVLAVLLVACGTSSGGMNGPSMNNKVGGDEAYRSPVVSWDILDREPVANEVEVKHILIGWKELADAYGGQIDDRAAARSRKDAEAEVKTLLGQLAAGADFDKTMQESSEDGVSARSGTPIPVTPDSGLVIEFRLLSLRLKPGEIGVCQSQFGFHIIKRM